MDDDDGASACLLKNEHVFFTGQHWCQTMIRFDRDGSAMHEALKSELKSIADSLAVFKAELAGMREDGRTHVDCAGAHLQLIRTESSDAASEASTVAVAAQSAAAQLQRDARACRISQQLRRCTLQSPVKPVEARPPSATLTFLSGLAIEIPLPATSCIAALRQKLQLARPPEPWTKYELVVGTRVLQDADILRDDELASITVVSAKVCKEAAEDEETPDSDLEYACFAGYCSCKCKECHDTGSMMCSVCGLVSSAFHCESRVNVVVVRPFYDLDD